MLPNIIDYLNSAINKKAIFLYSYHNIGSTNIKYRSSNFILAILVTILIIFAQVFLFHYYIGISSINLEGKTKKFDHWNCLYPGLSGVYSLAQKFDVDLVIVDPDLLRSIKREVSNEKNSIYEVQPQFSIASKRVQETRQKTVIHLAAINETSGGQPNLKLFHDSLKHNGYTILSYVDNSHFMQTEVYRRLPHLHDDVKITNINGHRYYNDLDDKHSLEAEEMEEESLHNAHPNRVSKIYTEFLSHIFILNYTHPQRDISSKVDRTDCWNSYDGITNPFIVIHVVVLYNYEYNPSGQWIQPSLIMDEMDKHKLLRYGVHSFDFAIPIDRYYLHRKRPVMSVVKASDQAKQTKEKFLVFDPSGDGLLSYVNNSYIHCAASKFYIGGLIEDPKRYSNYLKALDSSSPMLDPGNQEFLTEQVATAIQFIDTYSKTYGNFSYWITGSTLLAYYKFCELALVPHRHVVDFEEGSIDPSKNVINLELGFFSSEVTADILDDLAEATNIGVTMISDWQKPNSIIIFKLLSCPNIIFYMYPYKLRNDFSQSYFITTNTMTYTHKFNKRSQVKNTSNGHHIFHTDNLHLCWTRLNNIYPFRVPCNIHDHLRRIYLI